MKRNTGQDVNSCRCTAIRSGTKGASPRDGDGDREAVDEIVCIVINVLEKVCRSSHGKDAGGCGTVEGMRNEEKVCQQRHLNPSTIVFYTRAVTLQGRPVCPARHEGIRGT